ncbi:protein O-mannosyl-transferase family [Sulfurihydrogenibium azorense]|uniref:protein O-mannosyl-transferase family n=1 Tax=Sulfurihydrogenibium azorense TaxID=309806 RepID=UPI0024092BF3|nr:DUF2723 domain-containing protein [Sulfurihydrogenibium azorense]MDM7273172.1 DUF2723 domain-containing protein [Sulfurihydrogenibium azorense]
MYRRVINVNILLALIIILYVFSLFPVFSTGDGGGLVVASHLLGIAHPPGYPFYIELSKLFSLLPVANIGIRIGLLTVIFSALSLYLLYLIVTDLTNKPIYGLISVSFLAVSYSFYYNSVVIKFYTLNLFFILLLTYLGIKVLKSDNLDKRLVYLSAFLLGIGSSIHHTLLIMFLPLFIVGLYYCRQFVRLIPLSFLFFIIGFFVNLHLYIRSIKDTFSAAHKADTLERFIAMILRKFYGESSSIDATKGVVSTIDSYIYTLKNLFYLFSVNFSYAFVFLAFIGAYLLYKSNKKLFLFLFTSFFLYSVILGKITLSIEVLDLATVYVSGNQYFLPALSFLIVFCCYFLYKFFEFLKERGFNFVYSVILPVLVVFPFTFLFSRFVETNHFNNWVPYYHAKDLLSYSPVASLVSTYGDNHTFKLWYLKLVGRYRDDVCHITSHYYNSIEWRVEGCKPKEIYKPLIPEFFAGNLNEIMNKKIFISTVALAPTHPLYNFVEIKPFLFTFFYVNKNDTTPPQWYNRINIEKAKFLSTDVCLNHNVDDPFTLEMCNFFSNAYLVLASSIVPTFKLNEIDVDASISYGKFLAPFRLKIYLSPQNQSFIEIYKALRAYNNPKQSYLLPEE